MSMKLHVLSDLHTERTAFAVPSVEADMLILAGDIASAKTLPNIKRIVEQVGYPVLMISGNHEYYGGDVDAVQAKLLHYSDHIDNFWWHEKTVHERGGVRFLCCTLWTGFKLYTKRTDKKAQLRAEAMINDFRVIYADGKPISSGRMVSWWTESVSFLETELRRPFDGKTVVVTHFAPAPQSIAPRFANAIDINPYFVNDLRERLIMLYDIDLWIHGHCHDSSDYELYGTHVIANPRGYHRSGNDENPSFNPSLVVEV